MIAKTTMPIKRKTNSALMSNSWQRTKKAQLACAQLRHLRFRRHVPLGQDVETGNPGKKSNNCDVYSGRAPGSIEQATF
jgi:hypothetical protein